MTHTNNASVNDALEQNWEKIKSTIAWSVKVALIKRGRLADLQETAEETRKELEDEVLQKVLKAVYLHWSPTGGASPAPRRRISPRLRRWMRLLCGKIALGHRWMLRRNQTPSLKMRRKLSLISRATRMPPPAFLPARRRCVPRSTLNSSVACSRLTIGLSLSAVTRGEFPIVNLPRNLAGRKINCAGI